MPFNSWRVRHTRVGVLSLPVLLLLLAACGGADLDPGPGVVRRVPPGAGVQFAQVDFLLDQGSFDSAWGRMEIDAQQIESRTGLQGGYLNVATNQARLVSNLSLPPADGGPLAVYFDLAAVASGDVTSARLYVLQSDRPLQDLLPYLSRSYFYDVDDVAWAHEFETDQTPFEPPSPPPLHDLVLAETPSLEISIVRQRETNVQTATGQCFPMAVANALQYLEDRGVLLLGHDHVPGLLGDDSLVGVLDELSGRILDSREIGLGLNTVYMIDATFDYFDRNSIHGVLYHLHQDRGLPGGWIGGPMLPDGDYSSHGYTTRDAGAIVTFDWIFDRLLAHAGVVLCYRYPGGSGHAVRVVGAGKGGDRQWLECAHDRLQTAWDPTDVDGLEIRRVHIVGLTPEGRMRFDSEDVVVRCVWALEPIASAVH